MPWVKGQSGNPIGPVRAQREAALRRLEGATPKVAEFLIRVALGEEEATMGERITAAKEVFDRAWGKAKTTADIKIEHSPNAHLQVMAQLLAEAKDRLGPKPEDKPLITLDIIPDQDKQPVSNDPDLIERSFNTGLGPAKAPANRPTNDPPGGQGTPGGGL
jgi:hypothetical protein